MAALASLSDLVNRQTGGSDGTPDSRWIYKLGRVGGTNVTAPVVGQWNSMWLWDGMPGTGVTPGAAAVPTNATVGAVGQADAGGSRQKWMVGGGFIGSAGGNVVLYDRLLHCGGLDGTVTDPQAVGGSLTRNTSGLGNEIWVEIYTQIGATARTISASYTNQDDTSGQATTATSFGGTGSREATRSIRLPLQAGDTGVKSVETVTIDGGTTGTAGDFGVTIVQPIATWPLTHRGSGLWRSFMDGYAIPEIVDGACLAMMYLAAATTVPAFHGLLTTVEA